MMPLAFQQRGLWFINQLEGPSATYNVPIVLRLRGSLDIDALRAALHDVVGRHETLRTMFPDADGVPYQRMLDASDAGIGLETRPVGETDLVAAVEAAAAGRSTCPGRYRSASPCSCSAGPLTCCLC